LKTDQARKCLGFDFADGFFLLVVITWYARLRRAVV